MASFEMGDEDETQVLAYKVLPKHLTADFLQMDTDSVHRRVADFLEAHSFDLDLKEAIAVDIVVGVFHWCKVKGLGQDAVSFILTIIARMFHNLKGGMSLSDNFTEFTKLLVSATDCAQLEVAENSESEESGEMPITVFRLQDAKDISDFFYSVFFQHYRLFQRSFLREKRADTLHQEIVVETLNKNIPPLLEGIAVDMEKNLGLPLVGLTQDKMCGRPSLSSTHTHALKGVDSELDTVATTAARTSTTADLVAKMLDTGLSPTDIREIICTVTKELLPELQRHVSERLVLQEHRILAALSQHQEELSAVPPPNPRPRHKQPPR